MPRNTGTNEPRQTRAQREAEAQERIRNAERKRELISRFDGKALQYAAEAGKELIEAKELAGHGKFKRWLREHFHGSKDTAEDYMRVARYWPRFSDAGSIRESLKWIRIHERRVTEHGEGRSAVENSEHPHAYDIEKAFHRTFTESIRSKISSWIDRDAAVFLASDGSALWEATLEKIGDLLGREAEETLNPAYREWRERRDRAAEEHLRRTTVVPDQPLPEQPVRIIPRRRIGQVRYVVPGGTEAT